MSLVQQLAEKDTEVIYLRIPTHLKTELKEIAVSKRMTLNCLVSRFLEINVEEFHKESSDVH